MAIYSSLFLLILIIANASVWHSLFLGTMLGLIYLLYYGYLLGKNFFGKESFTIKALTGSFFIFSLISLIGAIFYYAYKLSMPVVYFILFLIPLIILSGQKFLSKHFNPAPPQLLTLFHQAIGNYLKIRGAIFTLKYGKKDFILKKIKQSALLSAYLILFIISWMIIASHTTTQSIRSLWDALPYQFIFIYLAATAILAMLIVSLKKPALNIVLIIGHVFLTLSLGLFVYQIGYGFDPFIHQATEKIIAQAGFIAPKTPYYIGQYSLVVILSSLFQISIVSVDKFILPILFSLFIPLFIYLSYKKITENEEETPNNNPSPIYLLPLAILIIPFSDFIATTPQGLANFFTLVIILLSTLLINRQANYNLHYLLIFLALVTTFIHPLTGLPIFIFTITLAIINCDLKNKYLKWGLVFLTAVAALLALPMMFFIQSLLYPELANPLTWQIDWPKIKEIITPTTLIWQQKFNIAQDLFHFIGNNIRWLLIISSGLGLYFSYKTKDHKKYYPYIFFFLIFILVYILLKILVSFQSVIAYEQNNYPLRILNLSFYFLLPLIFLAIHCLTKKILTKNWLERLFYASVFSLLVAAALYLSYPFHDAYKISHYYSTSSADIQAVDLINQKTTGDYVVLANQSVSAAALKEFGFKKYFNTKEGELFYYPIPTSSPLYQYYLNIVNGGPIEKNVEKAMDLTGTNQGYLILNKYWTDYEKLIKAARTAAASWEEIDGQISIFYFKK